VLHKFFSFCFNFLKKSLENFLTYFYDLITKSYFLFLYVAFFSIEIWGLPVVQLKKITEGN